MTTPTDLTDLVHSAQLAVVTKAQDLAVSTVRQLADLRDRAPRTPAVVTRVTQPLTAHWAAYRSDWATVNRSFQDRLTKAVQYGSNAPKAEARPTVVKSSTAKKSSAKS